MTEARIHCTTYRQLAALKAVLDSLGKKLAAKAQDAALAEHEEKGK